MSHGWVIYRRGDANLGETDRVSGKSEVVGVLLAAGGGSRFEGDEHKLLTMLPATAERPEEPVASRSTASLIEAAIGPVVIVTGSIDIGTSALRDETHPDLTFAHNAGWKSGQASSIQLGARTARAVYHAKRVVIGLADQPGITPEAWQAVALAGADASLAVATYDGRRGNPVAVHLDIWHLMPEAGDEGARSLMRLRPDLVVEVPCSGSSDDIDTTEDLRRWQNNSSTNSP